MFNAFVPVPLLPEHLGYRPVPAVYAPGPAVEGGPLPQFGGIGTGGLESAAFYVARAGYRAFELVAATAPTEPTVVRTAPFAQLMQVVKDGFGRTMSYLPGVFGVSRQTLYNWLGGETPKEQHHGKLRELAAAARVFQELGFKPTASSLDRTVRNGKSLLQLISEGADGDEMARKLVRISLRGALSQANVDALLGGRISTRLEPSDMGAPSLAEDA